jgi:hypothetical protein
MVRFAWRGVRRDIWGKISRAKWIVLERRGCRGAHCADDLTIRNDVDDLVFQVNE